jgi:hypothetical protein
MTDLLLQMYGREKLIKVLDGEKVLAETDFSWKTEETYVLALEVNENRICAWVDGEKFFDIVDAGSVLNSGAIAFIVDEGCFSSNAVSIKTPV